MTPASRTRRRLIVGASAAVALAPLGARAQGKNIRVVIPTGQGGGAERLARSFDDVWSKLLKTNFEYSFYAGTEAGVRHRVRVRALLPDGTWGGFCEERTVMTGD